MPINIGPRHTVLGDLAAAGAAMAGGYGHGYGQQSSALMQAENMKLNAIQEPLKASTNQTFGFLENLAYQNQAQQNRLQLQQQAASNAMAKLGATQAGHANAAYMRSSNGVPLMYPDEMPGYQSPESTTSSCPGGVCGGTYSDSTTVMGGGLASKKMPDGFDNILAPTSQPAGGATPPAAPQRPMSVYGQWMNDLHTGQTLDEWPTYAKNFASKSNEQLNAINMAKSGLEMGFDNDLQKTKWEGAQAKEREAQQNPAFFDTGTGQWNDLGVKVRQGIYRGIQGPHPVPKQQTIQDVVNSGQAFGVDKFGNQWYDPDKLRPFSNKPTGPGAGDDIAGSMEDAMKQQRAMHSGIPQGAFLGSNGNLHIIHEQPATGGPPHVEDTGMTPDVYRARKNSFTDQNGVTYTPVYGSKTGAVTHWNKDDTAIRLNADVAKTQMNNAAKLTTEQLKQQQADIKLEMTRIESAKKMATIETDSLENGKQKRVDEDEAYKNYRLLGGQKTQAEFSGKAPPASQPHAPLSSMSVNQKLDAVKDRARSGDSAAKAYLDKQGIKY